jgi:hypothetical protein
MPSTEPQELYRIVDGLVESWCARRQLAALRILLPAWPMPMGLTDDRQELRSALRHVRAMCKDSLPDAELVQLGRAISIVDQALDGR